MTKRWKIVACGAALVASCGKTEGEAGANGAAVAEAPAASESKACDVLTQADAAKALGREVTKFDAGTSASAAAGQDICQYGYSGERLMDQGQASVTLVPGDLASLRKQVEAQGWTTEPVAGLGDGAFYSKEAGLYVATGGRSAVYLVGAGGMDDVKTPSIALAKATMDRI